MKLSYLFAILFGVASAAKITTLTTLTTTATTTTTVQPPEPTFGSTYEEVYAYCMYLPQTSPPG